MRPHADMAWQEFGSVFPSVQGSPLDSGNMIDYLLRQLDTPDLPRVTFHALRHTCGSVLHHGGVPARTIMTIFDHSRIALTLGTYCHADDAGLTDAAAVLARALRRVR